MNTVLRTASGRRLPMISLFLACLMVGFWSAGWGQTVYSGADNTASCTSGPNTAWLTPGNWCGGVLPNATTYAQFGNMGETVTIGFSMSLAKTPEQKIVAAIELMSGGYVRTIINSGNTSGSITLMGATINSIPNVIIRNASSNALTIADGSKQKFGIVLGNTTNNIINIDG